MLSRLFLVSSVQLLRFCLIKFSTLVGLLLIVCICDDHDIVLSIPKLRCVCMCVCMCVASLPTNYDTLKYLYVYCMRVKEQVQCNTTHLLSLNFIYHLLVHSHSYLHESSCNCFASCSVVIGL